MSDMPDANLGRQTPAHQSLLSRPQLESAGLQDLEDLGYPAFRQPTLRCHLAEPDAQPLFQPVRVADLASVAAQRCDLAAKGLGDVDIIRGRRSARDPDLADGPWLELLFRQQLREREHVARIRVDGVQGRGADSPVVGVTCANTRVIAIRRWAYYPLRLQQPDDPAQVTAQPDSGLDLAVWIAKEVQIVHADLFGSCRLLCLPQRCHLRAPDRRIASTSVSVGHDAVADVDPGVRPLRDRSGGAKVDIVWVGGNHQNAANLCFGRHHNILRLTDNLLSSTRAKQDHACS